MAEWKVKSVNGDPVEEKEVKQETPEVQEEPKQEADAVQQVQGEAEESVLRDEGVEETSDEKVEVKPEEPVKEPEEEPIIEIVDEEEPEVKAEEPAPTVEEKVLPQTEAPKLPEGIEKLIAFMDETGGSLEDYASLNKNYDDLKPVDLMREYYKQTKPHLSSSEIDFLMDEKFATDEDADAREKRAKEILWKEEVYNAKQHLTSKKDKYYSDLKLGRNQELAPEQLEAIDFYTAHKETQKNNEQLKNTFLSETDKVFTDLKGFDFKVGDKKYRYKVNDVDGTKKYQSDLNNFIQEFLGENGAMKDAKGYHKAIFAAKNADKIAQHFYDQGRSDGLKEHTGKAKNIDMGARADMDSVTTSDGAKFKVVSGDSKSKFKLNLKNY